MQGRDMNRLKIRLKNLQRRIQDEWDMIELFEHRGMHDVAERGRVRLVEMEAVEAEILAEIRGIPPAASAVKLTTNQCPKGHDYTDQNTIVWRNGKKLCRKCQAAKTHQPKRVFASARTHCPSGHEYIGTNLIIDTKGARRCRTCKAIQDGNRRQMLKVGLG